MADRVNARAEALDALDLSLRNHHPLFCLKRDLERPEIGGQ
jgi:hypothetical protein